MADQELTITEAARLVGVSTSTLRRAAERGILKARKAGPRAWLTTQAALDEWITKANNARYREKTVDVEIFVACDAATVSEGKLNILGSFDTLNVPTLPFTLASWSVALSLRFMKIENGVHNIVVEVIDADGSTVASLGPITANIHIPTNQESTSLPLALNFQGFQFNKAGSYDLNLAIDNRLEAQRPLYVRQLVPTR